MSGARELTWQVLLRNKWLIISFVLLASGATAAASKLQPPAYIATATLVVNQPSGDVSFDLVQATQAYARTLASLIDSRNVAREVLEAAPVDDTPGQLLERMSFSPVAETQLIEINAESGDAQEAAAIANAYASTFVDYVSRKIPSAAPSSGISIADEAVVPAVPAKPKPTLYTLLAVVLSTAVIVAFVLGRARLDTRVRDSDALQEALGLPVLGILPKFGKSEASHRVFEEAVRLLANSLAHAGDRPLNSILLTSTHEKEGKSTVVAELARALGALSLLDNAVLAVDADLRRPSLLRRFDLPEGPGRVRGLTSYLRDESELDWAATGTQLASVRVLPSGPLPTHPSALLGFPSSRQKLSALRDHADVVLIDTPPLTVGADASIVAMDVDCALLVVDLSRSRVPELRAAVDQLEKVGRRPLGVVVNRADLRDRTSAYASYTSPSRPADQGDVEPGRRVEERPSAVTGERES